MRVYRSMMAIMVMANCAIKTRPHTPGRGPGFYNNFSSRFISTKQTQERTRLCHRKPRPGYRGGGVWGGVLRRGGVAEPRPPPHFVHLKKQNDGASYFLFFADLPFVSTPTRLATAAGGFAALFG